MTCPPPLTQFIAPMLDLPAWDVKQGHGSFLTFQFGQPHLDIAEHRSGKRRSAHVRGQWQVWIYCCAWRVMQDGIRLAGNEDDTATIARASATLNGQKLMALDVRPDQGRSWFTFDLGGVLETWPYGQDDDQWMITSETEVFTFNADGRYTIAPSNTPLSMQSWRAFSGLIDQP
jgi:hypothetical protein